MGWNSESEAGPAGHCLRCPDSFTRILDICSTQWTLALVYNIILQYFSIFYDILPLVCFTTYDFYIHVSTRWCSQFTRQFARTSGEQPRQNHPEWSTMLSRVAWCNICYIIYIYTVYIVYHSIIYIYISISILSISLSISISIYTYHIYLLYGGWSKGPCKESCLRRSFIWCFETSPKFFFEFAKVTFYLAKASRKLGIIIVYMHNL